MGQNGFPEVDMAKRGDEQAGRAAKELKIC
jgi:hypothetical protein